ncbi:exported hypothetical protein [Candidatus Sulfopaludibacter sp. SbA4]|nr:exported hypothetical protein [Candidatus Sulfopaludibacter sp. SbA4]
MRYLLLLAFAMPAFAQKAETDQPVLQTLLAEVQQLRLAIERSTLLGTRAQIALSRLQMDEGTAAKLSQELSEVRRQALSMATKRAELSERTKDLEARTPPQGMTPEQWQFEIKQSKIELEEIAAAEQERTAREAELVGQFQAAQNQLAQSRAAISEMERSLDAAIQQLLKPH